MRLFAQDNYEIMVYASDLTEKRATRLEIHSNYTFKGNTLILDNTYPSHRVLHETIEITHGFTPWFEVGTYLFSSFGSENRTSITGVHFRPRISIPEKYDFPVGLSLGTEIGYQKREFFGSKWAMEIRPIIDKSFERFYISLNLTMGLSLDKDQPNELEFSPCFKTSYEVNKSINLGFEYYSDLGAFRDFSPPDQQQHHLFGVLDWDFHPDWEFNAGIGYGLSSSSDKWIAKLVLGWKLPI